MSLKAAFEKAGYRNSREEVASYENRLSSIDRQLGVLTWMVGTNLVVTLGVLWRLLAHA
jgi:hypothetical protein